MNEIGTNEYEYVDDSEQKKRQLGEIRKCWQEETDNWLIKAATIDINEYSEEIQEIIISEVHRRGLEGVEFQDPSIVKEAKDNVNEFFEPEKQFIQLGVIGGIIMMVFSVIWFVLGLIFGWVFWYPPILFLVGLYAFLKGIITGNIAGINRDVKYEEGAFGISDEGQGIIYNKKHKGK